MCVHAGDFRVCQMYALQYRQLSCSFLCMLGPEKPLNLAQRDGAPELSSSARDDRPVLATPVQTTGWRSEETQACTQHQ